MTVLFSQCFPQDESRGCGDDLIVLCMKLLLGELVLPRGAPQQRPSVWWDLVSGVSPECLRERGMAFSDKVWASHMETRTCELASLADT